MALFFNIKRIYPRVGSWELGSKGNPLGKDCLYSKLPYFIASKMPLVVRNTIILSL